MAVASGAAILLCVLAGPFGTAALPLATRTLFWAVLIGLNALKWWAWYRFAIPHMPVSSRWAALLPPVAGALVLNASLPLEINWLYRAVGVPADVPWLGLYLMAGLISASIIAIVAAATPSGPDLSKPDQTRLASSEGGANAEDGELAEGRAQAPTGLAARTDLQQLLAVTAEDHYVRLHLDGGMQPLHLYRFRDALAELSALDGMQVHRSAWVASRAVTGAERSGRRWTLHLADGTRLQVSESRVAAVRARGWLRPTPGKP